MFEFARPIWLLLLLALPAIYWLALRMSYASLGPYQKWISLALRVVIWLLLVSSLAGVQFVRHSDRVSVIIVRDSSDSVDEAQLPAIQAELEAARKTMRKDDSLGKVNFGADAYLEFLPQPGVDERLLYEWQTEPRGNFTNIGEAIQVAVASYPDNAQKRLVLITDGNENVGNSLAEARVARDNGVELYTVALGRQSGPEVVLASLDAPSQASLAETVNVRFVIDSTVATQAEVSLIRNGEFVDKVPISIRPGKEVYEFPVTIDQSGFFTYELVLEPELDTVAENNRAYTFSVVAGQPRLLYATGDPAEFAYLPRTLQEHTIKVDVVQPGGIPYSLEDFQVYDGIIFSDVAAYDITDDQMMMIQLLVRDFGRGFLMIGGEKSFGPGGYFDTPIEETLPVDMDFRRKKITPSSLVVCLIDKSSSMGATVQGVQKIAMAKTACEKVVDLQQRDDWVAVMGFDAVGQWVVEPTKGIDKSYIINQIRSMQAGGGTDLYPALKAAWEASKSIPVQIKHFIVFTDGIVAPADFEGLLGKMVKDNITVSTVAFGTDADIPFMRQLAELGDGNMYEVTSLHQLPKIFTREVFMANKATLTEEPFAARPTGDHPLVSAIGWGRAPALYGYVATAAKDNAQVLLVTHKDDPLLAVWRYGLGKSAAFTSDAKNRWATDWLGWQGYEKFWAGVARWIRSDLDSGGLEVTTSLTGREGLIQVSAVGEQGGFVNYSNLEARITDPELNTQSIVMEQVGPGQYEGRFEVSKNGNYFVNVVQLTDDGAGNNVPSAAQATGLAVSYSPEYKDLEPDKFLLSQLQSSSLAQDEVIQAGLANVFTAGRKPTRRLEDAWELFTLIALCLWLLDVAVRRLVLDWQEIRLAVAGAVGGAAGKRAARVSESLAGLMTAKSRAARRTSFAGKDDELEQRRESLAAKAASLDKTAGERPAMPADEPEGKIAAPERGPLRQEAGSALSDLRKRMSGRPSVRSGSTGLQEEVKQPSKGAPGGADVPAGGADGPVRDSSGMADTAVRPTKARPTSPASPARSGQELTESEFTRRLRERKRRKKDD
ncbi:VWA domain-containing protein [bacterium]|nr:VWA domain-containing protein [bacterium]